MNVRLIVSQTRDLPQLVVAERHEKYNSHYIRCYCVNVDRPAILSSGSIDDSVSLSWWRKINRRFVLIAAGITIP
jgi:hypothetical protein